MKKTIKFFYFNYCNYQLAHRGYTCIGIGYEACWKSRVRVPLRFLIHFFLSSVSSIYMAITVRSELFLFCSHSSWWGDPLLAPAMIGRVNVVVKVYDLNDGVYIYMHLAYILLFLVCFSHPSVKAACWYTKDCDR